jgi:hypothetical protein
MRRNIRPLVLILSGLLLLLVASFSANLIGASVGAQNKTGIQLERSKWEYSVLSVNEVYGNEKGKTTCVASICYLRSSGARCEKVEATVDGGLDRSAGAARTEVLARAIGKLGDEGWEMVGDGLGLGKEGEIKSLYFRRAKH